jgi:hypothetical protein
MVRGYRWCDELDGGFGWIADERMERCSHALAVGGRVWLVDPLDAPGLDERVRELGEPAAVVQLLDRHQRDCAAIAARLGVPHEVVPFGGVGPFETLPVVDRRRWREAALWWPERRILVTADALGTARYYRARDDRLAVHPVLRLVPPRALGALEPLHVLGGHGEGVHEDASEALREALRTARRRLPAAWGRALLRR